MAKVQINQYGVTLWVSAAETSEWGRHWPLSRLRGHRLVAQFDARGNLVDYKVDGRGGADIPSDEFNALTSDMLRPHLPTNHSAYAGCVGQFYHR